MTDILVGTSGYSYLEWVGPVYPAGTKQEDFLALYATLFPTVELNFSYYRMPSKRQIEDICSRSGPKLSFAIKANDSMTHRITSSWKESVRDYRDAIEPLMDGNRLTAVLLQFPYSFHYDVDNRRYLDALLKELRELPVAVEFRVNDWYNNRVFESLSARGIALVSLDLPALKNLPPVVDVVTAPFAYVRFHGRNAETWWGSDSAARYDYLYSEAELVAWGERIKGIAKKAQRLLVYFNNHRRGQAVENAKSFQGILKKAGLRLCGIWAYFGEVVAECSQLVGLVLLPH